MPIRNLNHLFSPKTVAIVGASQRVGSVGNIVTQNLVRSGYAGRMFAVNRHYDDVEGIACYPSIDQLPERIDLAILCTPAESTPKLIDQCGRKSVKSVVVLAAGFRESGSAGRELEAKLRDASRRYPAMRIVGPNSLGIISPHSRLNASFADVCPAPGKIALLSQSGALGTAMLDWAREEQIGFSHFVSFGNLLDVSIADLIDYLAEDSLTEAIIMYVESIQNARAFMSAARAFTKSKPIIAFKPGRFEPTAQASALHTGGMVGVDSVYDAAFARAGIVRVDQFDDLIDCAEILARHRKPTHSRVAVITNAGAAGVMAADALLQRGCHLAELTPPVRARLSRTILDSAGNDSASVDSPSDETVGDATIGNFADPSVAVVNPIDVLGDATADRYAAVLDVVLKEQTVDAAIVILTPQTLTDPDAIAEVVIEASRRTAKPILSVWMGGNRVRPAIGRLAEAGIPTYPTPAKAAGAFSYLHRYAKNREVLRETPRSLPIEFLRDRQAMRGSIATLMLSESNALTESSSKALLEAYDIQTTRPVVVPTEAEAIRYASQIGYPVVMKVHSPDIVHKTEVGGVVLNVTSEHQVGSTWRKLHQQAHQHADGSDIHGVTIQPMVVDPNARELMIGAKRDPVFGAVMLVGRGGIDAEIRQDWSLELPPLNERLARRMLESLQCWPTLQAYRGKPAVDLDELIRTLLRFSYLIADHPEIAEIDVNPLLVTPDRVLALDATIVLEDAETEPTKRSRYLQNYHHLAIRPYPDELVRFCRLPDRTEVTLRPIRPEDEPQWLAMMRSCSEETIRMRFRYLLRVDNHDLAARFCFTDYDRELAIVAEIQDGGQSHIAGVGRLVADADHREAEFAVLVADPWQGRGLGALLTDACLSICDSWGIETVTAEVDPQNRRMLQMFDHRGFVISHHHDEDILLTKQLIRSPMNKTKDRKSLLSL